MYSTNPYIILLGHASLTLSIEYNRMSVQATPDSFALWCCVARMEQSAIRGCVFFTHPETRQF